MKWMIVFQALYLYIPATRFSNFWKLTRKLENLSVVSNYGNIWLEQLWELSVSSCLDIFNLGLRPQWKKLKVGDLGDGEEIQMAEQQ